jgi:hypothetical protein
MHTTWKENERRAAKVLGLSAEPEDEHEQVTTLDVEVDSGERVVLTIVEDGSLSVQVYTESSRGRPLWSLAGTAVVDRADMADWTQTLHETVRKIPRQKT